MPKQPIGFYVGSSKPEFAEVTIPLRHYKTHGGTVQYQVVVQGKSKTTASVYLPKLFFPEGHNFPDRVEITVRVPEAAEWKIKRD